MTMASAVMHRQQKKDVQRATVAAASTLTLVWERGRVFDEDVCRMLHSRVKRIGIFGYNSIQVSIHYYYTC